MSSPPAPTAAPGLVEKGPASGTSSADPEQQLPIHGGDLQRTKTVSDRVRSSFRVQEKGESGRRGIHPWTFLRITFRSSSWASRIVNVLWPLVPAAIAVRYALPNHSLTIFILSYLAMVPCANLLGFAGQELARKVPHVMGVLTETTLGSLTEIILFMVLITREDTPNVNYVQVIQAAILGSILATMLLCLGLCFIAGGFKREDSSFSEAVSEVGSGLLLTAGFGLAIPTVFEHSLTSRLPEEELISKAIDISRSTAILLMIAYGIFVYFQTQTHHGIYDAIFIEDTERDNDKRKDDKIKYRLTFTEVILALVVAIGLVAFISTILVTHIHFLVEERHVSDAFVGLILIPLVEKAAEHLTAIDEAYDDQMNFALSHVLGATLQTALFNAPLVVIVGWCLGKPMGLNFEVFDLAVLLLAIITVGNFLRDQKSNYLEGALCVLVYIAIAVAAIYYPNPVHLTANGTESAGAANGTADASATATAAAHHR
ncbi:hypothetical protein B0H63DRAFT_115437 [Podospora didyma]|uniref:Vacuolar calcium ion transporter n=1 Tax=Podospora didyma TaxID=330526 RepID=A0AAE0U4S5_9PEZI|nr:hypothetical protein B0H63DRAFT_115437 [Podospora didyma]